MPELPEVETIARTLTPHIVGKKMIGIKVLNDNSWQGDLKTVDLVNENLIPLVSRVGRRGKMLLIFLEYEGKEKPAFALGVHLKMTGKLFPYSKEIVPNKHTRIILELDGEQNIFFDDMRKFGYIRALSDENVKNFKFWQNLGKDPFEMKVEEFVEIFKNKKAGIKSLLLNQELIAGIGNIYADEALFKARINPSQTANSISEKKLEALFKCIVEILVESIEACGSSIRDYRTANGDVGSFQNKFNVYNRAGQICKNCSENIEKMKVAGRTTCYCPNCQSF